MNLIYTYKIPLLLCLSALLCFIVYIVLSIFSTDNSKTSKLGIEISDANSTEKNDETSTIFVDIQGAVEKPGVYQLVSSSRVADLINEAGGYSHQADVKWISKNINQAQLLLDGTKLYIPFQEEDSTSILGDTTKSSTGLVNINSASSSELETLTGIGPKRAQQIIDARPYAHIDELMDKEVLGEKTFESIKHLIGVY